MPEQLRLAPFAGALVRSEWTERVVTGAYDSFSPAERATITKANPYSYLNVTRSPEDVVGEVNRDELVAQCRSALDRIVEAGAFDQHDEPSLFLYRLEFEGQAQTGIVGIAPMDAYRSGQIGLHEGVRPARVELLVQHSTVVGATSSPVALAFDAPDEVLDLIDEMTAEEPTLEFSTAGVDQMVWRLTGDRAERLAAAATCDRAYITDGHHRGASANAAGENGLLVALFPMSEMRVYAFHRLLQDRQGLSADAIIEALGSSFVAEAAETPITSPPPGSFGLYCERRWFLLRYIGPAGWSAQARLDVSVLQDHIFSPVFGISDPGAEPSLRYVSDLVGVDQLAARCDSVDGAAFVVAPTSVEELVAVSDEHDVMPPKSSYFAPKPQSGIFLYQTGF